MTRNRIAAQVAALAGGLVVLLAVASATAQEAKQPILNQLEGLDGPFAGGGASKVTATATLQGSGNPRRATLFVTAEIAEGFHIYSITQKPGGPIASKISTSITRFGRD
jgi:hypothetical protein